MREPRDTVDRRQVVGWFCASTGSMVLGTPIFAASQQKRHPLIGLSCPTGMSENLEVLCLALRKALQQAAPGVIIRRTDQDIGPAPGALSVRLVPGAETDHALAARLQWKTAQSPDWITGPEIRTEAHDAPLRAAMMDRLATALIRVSALPLPGGAIE